MKQSSYKSYEEIPLFLNANDISKVIGIAPSSAYELMHEKDFPSIRIGKRLVVQRDKFIDWVDRHSKCGWLLPHFGHISPQRRAENRLVSRLFELCRKITEYWLFLKKTGFLPPGVFDRY